MLIKKYHFYKIISKAIVFIIVFLVLSAFFLSFLIVKQILLGKNEIHQETVSKIKRTLRSKKYNRTKVEYESDLSNYVNSSFQNENLYSNSITLVTAYFNLGSFQKGDQEVYTPELYKKWMRTFYSIRNPVVFYSDSQEICDYFRTLRQHLPKFKTKIILKERSSLWAFSIEKETEEIFKQVGYPKHYPNTVVPAYSCSMHAKYELLRETIITNPFKTKYIAWIDVGLFRNLAQDKNPIANPKKLKMFGLKLPPDFNEENIGYTEVHRRNDDLLPVDIVYINLVWVCGCFFLGRMDVMFRWTAEYMEGVEWLLRKRLMNTDQQIIYVLANSKLIKTQIQTYKDFQGHSWFYLGYLCKETWLKDKTFENLVKNLN
ncbi:hypothetical protein HELRODRAFT_161626 [Helobdella robusta]|uniref:Uncharacterized protein n=1 Tax=Helobdella robusta TaxID=6412 RepID=T1ERQ3_HELRO|nr:hypothetical protein HELRODRAFT_161626 [Helobdella robusta]ESO02366.1 hypothetical protein HELRODRAFT_161626 [Helobdella robusta]